MRKLASLTAIAVLTATVGFGGTAWAANTTVDFDGETAPVSGAALDTFLAGVGITLTNVTGAGSFSSDKRGDIRWPP